MTDKPTMNIIREWTLTRDNRIRGFARVDQPTAFVKAGDIIVTSRVESIGYKPRNPDNTVSDRIAVTANSVYILED